MKFSHLFTDQQLAALGRVRADMNAKMHEEMKENDLGRFSQPALDAESPAGRTANGVELSAAEA